MVDFVWVATIAILFLIGVVGIVMAVFVKPGKRATGTLGGVAVGFGILFLTIAVLSPSTLTTGGGQTQTAPPAATLNILSGSTPALPAGCTLYQNTFTIACTIVYNKTTNYFAISTTVATSGKPVYLVLPFSMIRTDAINQTFSFSSTVASIPTAASIGATPTVYSVVGYTAATSTVNGQWLVYPDQGTLATQKPTVNAPSVSTNVETTGVPIQAFGSKVLGWHITLAGSNSTSAPAAFAQALTNYTAYPMTFTFSNAAGAQASWTLTWTMIGWK